MKTYLRICLHLEPISLNIHRSEIFFEQKFQRQMKHAIYVQYTFPVLLKVLETNKTKRTRLCYIFEDVKC
jgi:hypothetical protein